MKGEMKNESQSKANRNYRKDRLITLINYHSQRF